MLDLLVHGYLTNTYSSCKPEERAAQKRTLYVAVRN